MTEISWVPGTVVLLVGLLGGLWAAFRLARPRSGAAAEPKVHDLELRIADLKARRDDLYARLRGEREEEIGEREAHSLERAAALTLRELDEARAALARLGPKAARGEKKAAKVTQPARPAAVRQAAGPAPAVRHPLMVGFLFGAGMVGLVGVLIFWALSDAKPGPRSAPAPRSASPPPAQAPGAPGDHPAGAEELSPEVRQQVAALEEMLRANPDDLAARKELAVLLVSHQQFFRAFQLAEEILQVVPNDPDGLYISGVVRLTMGQMEEAIDSMDRVLAQFPDHVLAYLVRGMAKVQLGDRDEAVASWERGLAAAGGRHPDIERLIAEARAGSFDPPTVPEAGAPQPASPQPAASPPPPASGSPASPRVYRVYVELVPGAEVKPGSSLFVSVHDTSGGGPPAAVKRVADPVFPVEVSLSSADSMMGIELPARGTIILRLDQDGDPGTEDPEDLAASGEGSSGEVTKFVLW